MKHIALVLFCIALLFSCKDDEPSTPELPEVVADFSASETTIEEGSSVTFTDQSTGNPTSWNWTFEGGDPATSTEQNPEVTYTTAGEFTAKLVVSNGQNNSSTETKTITVQAAAVEITAAFSQSADTISLGDVVTFTDESTGEPTSRVWTFEGGEPATSTEQNPEVTYTAAGSFTVTLKVTKGDAEDIEALENTVVVEDTVPLEAAFDADITKVKVGETVTFTDMSAGNPESWEWIFEGGDPATSNDQDPTVTYPIAGTYEVKLAVSRGAQTDDTVKTAYITVQDEVSAEARCLPTKIIVYDNADNKDFAYVFHYENERLVEYDYVVFDEEGNEEFIQTTTYEYNEDGYISSYILGNTGCWKFDYTYDEDGFLINEVQSPTQDDCGIDQWRTTQYDDFNEYNYPNQIQGFDNGDDGTTSELVYREVYEYENLTQLSTFTRENISSNFNRIDTYSYDDQKHYFSGLNELHLWGKGNIIPFENLIPAHTVALEHNITQLTTYSGGLQDVDYVLYYTYEAYNGAGYPLEFFGESSESVGGEKTPDGRVSIEYTCQ